MSNFKQGDVVFVVPDDRERIATIDGYIGIVLGFKDEKTTSIYALDLDLQQNWLRHKEMCFFKSKRGKGNNLQCYYVHKCYLRLAKEEDI